jgi:hypothetical protein
MSIFRGQYIRRRFPTQPETEGFETGREDLNLRLLAPAGATFAPPKHWQGGPGPWGDDLEFTLSFYL